jgi:hypothetical protein
LLLLPPEMRVLPRTAGVGATGARGCILSEPVFALRAEPTTRRAGMNTSCPTPSRGGRSCGAASTRRWLRGRAPGATRSGAGVSKIASPGLWVRETLPAPCPVGGLHDATRSRAYAGS